MPFFKKSLITIKLLLFPFILSSCALLLITEPDEHAKRAAANGGIADLNCRSCSDRKADYLSRPDIDFSKSRSSLLNPGNGYSSGSNFSAGAKGYQSRINKVKNFQKQLSSNSDAERTRAASSLGELGDISKPAVSDLERLCLRDKSKWVRRASVKALEKINGAGSRNVISQAAKYDKDPYVKGSAQSVLTRLSRAR